jgi:hypothetical protein
MLGKTELILPGEFCAKATEPVARSKPAVAAAAYT